MEGQGQLTTYLGTAPGVGKSYTMLSEARRRSNAGERVVVGWVEPHERPETLAQLGGLEVVAPIAVPYRGHEFPEMDVGAVLSAAPDIAVVDELAHSWPDGSRKRWTEVAALLAQGVHVFTSVNIANVVSARDYAARITGAGAVESVPDEFVRSGVVVLVDLPADALRARLASGKVFAAEQLGGALGQYFRHSNLEALSELGRAWLTGEVDEVGQRLLASRGLAPISARPVVIAGVSGARSSEAVIQRASELAAGSDSDLLVVHVRIADGLAPARDELLVHYRDLVEDMGASYVEVDGESTARALAEQASGLDVSTLVVGRAGSPFANALGRSLAGQLRRLRPDLVVEEVR